MRTTARTLRADTRTDRPSRASLSPVRRTPTLRKRRARRKSSRLREWRHATAGFLRSDLEAEKCRIQSRCRRQLRLYPEFPVCGANHACFPSLTPRSVTQARRAEAYTPPNASATQFSYTSDLRGPVVKKVLEFFSPALPS